MARRLKSFTMKWTWNGGRKNNCLAYKDLIYIYVENPFDFFFIAGHNIHVPVEFTRRSYIKALYARVYKYSIPSYATEIL